MEREHSNVCYIMKFDGKDENGKPIYRFEAVEKAKPFKNQYGLDIFDIKGELTEGRSGLKLCNKDQFESNMAKTTPEQMEKIINGAVEKYGLSPRYTRPEETKKDVFGEKESSGATLMKPIFIDGIFNREGKRIRAKQIKTMFIDGKEYTLWISTGKPENDYPKDENDKYYLMLLANDYLIPCGETEHGLAERAGYAKLNKEWYGDFAGRNKYFDELRKGKTYEESEQLIKARVAEENAFIKEYGKDEAAQAEYLKVSVIEPSIARWVDARDNGGKYYDFVGAAFLNELGACETVAKRIRAEREKEDAARREEARKKREQEKAEEARKEEQKLLETENILINGGKIEDGRLITGLADKYGITIPIRTRGWILNTFNDATIKPDGYIRCTYMRKRGSNTHGSDKIYNVLLAIKAAIKEAQSISA